MGDWQKEGKVILCAGGGITHVACLLTEHGHVGCDHLWGGRCREYKCMRKLNITLYQLICLYYSTTMSFFVDRSHLGSLPMTHDNG